MANVLATKYARALLDLVMPLPLGEQDEVLDGLRSFRDLYQSSVELRLALSSPAVVIVARQNVVVTLASRLGLNDLLRRFLLVVTEHGRLPLLPRIVASFEELIDEQAGRVTADGSVAQDLSADQRKAVEVQLSLLAGPEGRARFLVDPLLVGGFRAEIASTVYDASVRGQLDALRHRFKSVA